MTSDDALKKQDAYVRSRLVRRLEIYITSSILEVLIKSVSSSLAISNWSDEELQQIKKIVIVLNGILELHKHLANLSQPLISSYRTQGSSQTTSTPSPIPTEDGDATTSKQGSLQLQGGSLADKLPGTQD